MEMPTPIHHAKRANLVIPVSDHRHHLNTTSDTTYIIGHGVLHHDIVNLPFYGRVYDTVIIAHPLIMADRLSDPRTRPFHIRMLLDLLVEIQKKSQLDPSTRVVELRARHESIKVLGGIWRECCRYTRPRPKVVRSKVVQSVVDEAESEKYYDAEEDLEGNGQSKALVLVGCA